MHTNVNVLLATMNGKIKNISLSPKRSHKINKFKIRFRFRIINSIYVYKGFRLKLCKLIFITFFIKNVSIHENNILCL